MFEQFRGRGNSAGTCLVGVLFTTLLAATSLSSCSKEPHEKDEVEDLSISLNVTVNAPTKATGTTFDSGDAIGLSVVQWQEDKEQNLTAVRQEDNVKFANTSAGFVSTSGAYFPDKTSKNTFYAYYPWNAQGIRQGTSLLPISVLEDQQDKGYTNSDYMIAITRNVTPNSRAVPLVFSHILSKVSLVVVAGEGCTLEELALAKIRLNGFFTQTEYDLDKNAFGASKQRKQILPNGVLRETDGTLTGLQAIVIPQTRNSGESLFYFEIAGRTLAYKPSAPFIFEPGKEHTFTVTVVMKDMGPQIEVSCEIADWLGGTTIPGGADEKTPYLGIVTDIEGNSYRYVKINDVIWMADNLRSTKFNDGTPIEQSDLSLTWVNSETPAYTYYNNDPANSAKLGLLYNFHAARQEGKNICPQGWRLPIKREGAQLLRVDEFYDGNFESETLMALNEEWGSVTPTNTSGFTAVPSGMGLCQKPSGSIWWNTHEGDYWTSTQGVKRGGYFAITQYQRTDWHYTYVAMSIRCVKGEPIEDPDDYQGEVVEDIEGNAYPVVKIAGLEWMAGNLKTTKLNDGTPIAEKVGEEASWMELTTPAYCPPQDWAAYMEEQGGIYNHYAVSTGKLCPTGWRIPTEAEYKALLAEVPNPADLMHPDGSWYDITPTNTSGFGAYSVGKAIGDWWDSFPEAAYLWCSTFNTDNTKAAYCLIAKSTKTDYDLKALGMSVRCVKETTTQK